MFRILFLLSLTVSASLQAQAEPPAEFDQPVVSIPVISEDLDIDLTEVAAGSNTITIEADPNLPQSEFRYLVGDTSNIIEFALAESNWQPIVTKSQKPMFIYEVTVPAAADSKYIIERRLTNRVIWYLIADGRGRVVLDLTADELATARKTLENIATVMLANDTALEAVDDGSTEVIGLLKATALSLAKDKDKVLKRLRASVVKAQDPLTIKVAENIATYSTGRSNTLEKTLRQFGLNVPAYMYRTLGATLDQRLSDEDVIKHSRAAEKFHFQARSYAVIPTPGGSILIMLPFHK